MRGRWAHWRMLWVFQLDGAIICLSIDGFWSLIKRGIMGTFHRVSAKYLPLYVAEFEFRYNNRKNPDIFATAVGHGFVLENGRAVGTRTLLPLRLPTLTAF